MPRHIDSEDLAALRTHLLRQAVLFESSHAYAAGVNDALDAVAQVLEREDDGVLELTELSVASRMI